jgi:hypothetical protein
MWWGGAYGQYSWSSITTSFVLRSYAVVWTYCSRDFPSNGSPHHVSGDKYRKDGRDCACTHIHPFLIERMLSSTPAVLIKKVRLNSPPSPRGVAFSCSLEPRGNVYNPYSCQQSLAARIALRSSSVPIRRPGVFYYKTSCEHLILQFSLFWV